MTAEVLIFTALVVAGALTWSALMYVAICAFDTDYWWMKVVGVLLVFVLLCIPLSFVFASDFGEPQRTRTEHPR